MARKSAMPVLGVVADMGHSLLKIGVRTDNGEWSFATIPHALHKIPRRKWEQIVDRSGTQQNAADYMQVGQDYFILGESAERYGHATRKVGAARYSPDYIGVQVANMIARLSPYTEARVVMMALHPPADAEYRKELRYSMQRVWDVALGSGQEYMFHVGQVITTDEPVAGLMNVSIDKRLRQKTDITSAEVLVLDIGGGTTSVAPVMQGGAVDYGRIGSYPMGILNVTSKLQQNIFNKYRNMFMRTRQIRQDRLRDALLSGQFKGGGRTVNCEDEARAAKAELLAEIERMYYDSSVGGPLGFDIVILTGGGSVAMGADLRELLDHKHIKFAEKNHDEIHLANVHGASKMFDVLDGDGVITL